MTENTRHLTARVPAPLVELLDELARRRRQESGEIVHRADLVREALEALAAGGSVPPAEPPQPSLLVQAINCPDEHESMRLALEVVAQLAHDAQQRGWLTGIPQEMGMAVWDACDGRKDIPLLLDYVSKLHGALRAV